MKQQRFAKVFIWLFHLTYLRETRLIAWRDIFPQDSNSMPQDSNPTHCQTTQNPQSLFIWLFHLTYLRETRLIAWRDIFPQDSNSMPQDSNPTHCQTTQNPQSLQTSQILKTPKILPYTKAIRLDSTHRYLALLSHRNGALDGWVYGRFIPRFVFMMAKQLHKIWWLRVIFPGIAITRQKDDPLHYKRANLNALKTCVQALQDRQILCIFPEGTSSLGYFAWWQGVCGI